MSGFDDFIGQTTIKALLVSKIRIAKTTGTALPHLLLCGDEQQGKLTFANRVAEESGVFFSSSSADTLVNRLDLAGLMSKITAREVLAVANVDALRPNISEYLLQAISEFRFDFLIGTGAGARTATFDIPKFSFVGTTSKPWLVDARVRRWCIPIQFSPYTQDEVAEIVKRIAQTKDLCLDDEAASQVAMQSNLKLGEADVFLQKVRNHFSFNRADRIDRALVLRLGEYFGTCDPYPVSLAFADEVRSMDGIEFEHWVADLFTRAGFQVQVTKASGDHGVDLFASRAGCLIAVQCKRWEGPIGEPVVRDLYGSMTSAKAEAGCIVTTGFFTAQAQQFAAGKRVYLIPLDVLLTVAKSPLALNQILECA